LTKGPEAFRTISEASDQLGVPQHVLRFWETRFSFIRPMKRAGGRRFYRPQDLAVLRGVRTLLHDEGYTIKGVQKLHKEQGVKRLLAAGQGGDVAATDYAADDVVLDGAALSSDGRDRLTAALADLQSAKAHLDGLLQRR
jgi:DNA-binding transcriptional MerR regulator